MGMDLGELAYMTALKTPSNILKMRTFSSSIMELDDYPWLSKGKNTNRAQFFITNRKTKHLNRKHVVFGKVLKGMEVVWQIANVPATKGNNRSTMDVIIPDASHKPVKNLFPVTLDDAVDLEID